MWKEKKISPSIFKSNNPEKEANMPVKLLKDPERSRRRAHNWVAPLDFKMKDTKLDIGTLKNIMEEKLPYENKVEDFDLPLPTLI